MGTPLLDKRPQPLGNTFLNWVPLMDSTSDEELGVLVESAGVGANALRRCHSMPADLGRHDLTDGSQPFRSRTSPHRPTQAAPSAGTHADVTQTFASPDQDHGCTSSDRSTQTAQFADTYTDATQTPTSSDQDYQGEGLEPPAGQWDMPSPASDPDCCLYPASPENGFQRRAQVQTSRAGRRHLRARRTTQMATNVANYCELSDPKFRARHHRRATASSPMDEGVPQDPDTGVTTLMIRNLPARFGQSELLAELDRWGFAGCYDFCYLPRAFSTHHGQSYAFVNMTSVEAAASLVLAWHQKHCIGDRSYRAKLVISAAELQGFEANVLRWSITRRRRVQNPTFRPFVRDMRG